MGTIENEKVKDGGVVYLNESLCLLGIGWMKEREREREVGRAHFIRMQ